MSCSVLPGGDRLQVSLKSEVRQQPDSSRQGKILRLREDKVTVEVIGLDFGLLQEFVRLTPANTTPEDPISAVFLTTHMLHWIELSIKVFSVQTERRKKLKGAGVGIQHCFQLLSPFEPEM
ncbi:hypothetical protein [Pantoea agglomerans]|uniref:hypothetical protein n=1 Tax=Enterobacter agglomerans TaxID=549 RepID=UPI0013D4C1C1|nr:hypothetical protein [Pantoea agglomerans]NEG59686.1 hypothetical protein [Pantoea agglomerans]